MRLFRDRELASLPLLESVSIGGYESVSAVLGGDQVWINAANLAGSTSLHLAIAQGKRQVAILLLEHGANPHALAQHGTTPLHGAAATDGTDVAEALLDRGANVNVRNEEGESPLHLAGAAGHAAMIRLLLLRGASVHLPDIDGNTPLHVACLLGKAKSVFWLHQGGANAYLENDDGDTALSLAKGRGHFQCALLIDIDCHSSGNMQDSFNVAPDYGYGDSGSDDEFELEHQDRALESEGREYVFRRTPTPTRVDRVKLLVVTLALIGVYCLWRNSANYRTSHTV